jgi:hypothetical protein
MPSRYHDLNVSLDYIKLLMSAFFSFAFKLEGELM